VGSGQAKVHEDGEDFRFRLDDSDRSQEARAERALERVGASGFRAARKPLQENAPRNS
jgi:hypothetical protein